ncbi:hypothetical protein Aduo_002693 [Ancylostoma duodenale]
MGVINLAPWILARDRPLGILPDNQGSRSAIDRTKPIRARKTKAIYKRIFGHLKDQLERYGARRDLRIVLYYEKAAINAANSLFREAKVEGCAFHMAQAWNRRRDKLGLAKYFTRKARDRRIAWWWETLKGLVFLLKRLRSAVRALKGPPVPRGYQAYRKCQSFLRPLVQVGDKRIKELRRIEAFHSSLQRMLNCDHPPLATLIKTLKDLDLEAKCMPHEGKELRKRDALRRQRIKEEMACFESVYRLRRVQDHHVERYCLRMARFVSGKTN